MVARARATTSRLAGIDTAQLSETFQIHNEFRRIFARAHRHEQVCAACKIAWNYFRMASEERT